jgi:hypothetical protein
MMMPARSAYSGSNACCSNASPTTSSGTKPPSLMISWASVWPPSMADMVTDLLSPRMRLTKPRFAPFPEPGGPLRKMTSRGITILCM